MGSYTTNVIFFSVFIDNGTEHLVRTYDPYLTGFLSNADSPTIKEYFLQDMKEE